MANLNFGDGSWEEAKSMVQQLISDHEAAIHGNGREGMLTTLNKFITEYRTDRAADKLFHDQRDREIAQREDRRWRVAGLVLTIISAIIGVLSILEANRQIHGRFSTAAPNTVVSSTQKSQDAGSSAPVHY